MLTLPGSFPVSVSQHVAILPDGNQKLVDAHRCINSHFAACNNVSNVSLGLFYLMSAERPDMANME